MGGGLAFVANDLVFIELVGGTTASTVAQVGVAQPCTDRAASSATLIGLPAGAHRVRLSVGLPASLGARELQTLAPGLAGDPFASHCAGPRFTDLLLAKAFPLASYRRRHFRGARTRLHLDGRRTFHEAGFAGTVSTSAHLTLRKVKNEKQVTASG